MSNLNKSLIGDLQTKTLQEKIKDSITVMDINWLGYNHLSDAKPNTIERYNTQAHINRVLLWLSSKPHDYIRENLKGGVLYSLLGTLTSEDNLEVEENTIRSRFNEEFSGDLDLIYLSLKKSNIGRGLVVTMIVKDRLANLIIPINAEVTE